MPAEANVHSPPSRPSSTGTLAGFVTSESDVGPRSGGEKQTSCSTQNIQLAGGWSGQIVVPDPRGNMRINRSGFLPRREEWQEWLEQLLADKDELRGLTVLKHSPTYRVIRAQVSCGDRIIEIVGKHESGTPRVASLFRASRGRRSFERGWQLLNASIRTATPLAFVECRAAPRASWVILEYLDGLIDLDRFVLAELSRMDCHLAYGSKKSVARAVSELIAALDSAGLYHRDLKASNVMLGGLDAPDGNVHACIIDLDGLGRRHWFRHRWGPLVRLASSLLEYKSVGNTDYTRCLRLCLSQVGGNVLDWKALFRRLSARVEKRSSAARVRKSGKLDGHTGA